MPRRRRIGRLRYTDLNALEVDQEDELSYGPRTCRGPTCQQPGHRAGDLLPRIGAADLDPDPERPWTVVFVTVLGREGSTYRRELRPMCSAWADLGERRAAYWALRDQLLYSYSLAGTRPWAYWAIEIGSHPKWPPGEEAWLAEHRLLSDEEEGAILAMHESERVSVREINAALGTDRVSRFEAAAAIIRERRGLSEASAILVRSGEDV